MHRRLRNWRTPVFTLMLALCTVAAGVAAPTTAWAQDGDEERFNRAIGDALRAYNEGRYDKALDLYFEAKVIKDLAEIDYSIARTYHNLGQCNQAEKFYKKTQGRLGELPEGYEAKIDQYLAELPETCIPPEVEAPVIAEPEPVPVQPQPAPPPVDQSAEVDWLSIGIMGGGAAVLLAGLGVDLGSASLVDEHKDFATNPDSGTDEERRARMAELESDIDTRKIVVYTLYGVGGAALVTGTVLFFLRMDGDEAPADATSWQLDPTFGPDSAGMNLRASW